MNHVKISLIISVLIVICVTSCDFTSNNEVTCIRRPLTLKENLFFDSLKAKWNIDTMDIVRTDFSNCDETGSYNITFKGCEKAFILKTDSIKKWSEKIVSDLHTKVLSTKVACVTNDYHIWFEGKKNVINKTSTIKLDLTPSVTLWYDKMDVENFTGVKFHGKYGGKIFKRINGRPTVDTLRLDYFGFSNGEDPLK